MGASIERRTKIAAMNSCKSNRELIAFITGMGEVNHTCTILQGIQHVVCKYGYNALHVTHNKLWVIVPLVLASSMCSGFQ